MVSATVRVVGKKLVSCKIDVGDVVGHCGAVGHRIAPAINDLLSPAARSEKSNTPHQSAPMDRKSESRLMFRSAIVCMARSRAMKSTKVLKSLERLPKGPVTKTR